MTEFELKAYEKLFDSKHHYDNLSWIVGAPALALAGGLLAYMPTLHHSDRMTQIVERLIVAAFIWLILFGWQSIYQRNRFWVEAANEAIRDFERAQMVRGPGIIFMEAALQKEVLLKNLTEKGHPIEDPYPEKLSARSMHLHVPLLAKLVGLLALLACALP